MAFLEILDSHGRVVPLEKRWGHVAISYRGGWLHSFPGRPVEWISREDIHKYGRLGEILVIANWDELSIGDVVKELGKPFDHSYEWDSPDSTYCAKLVGQLLNIPPLPMTFAANIWRQHALSVSNDLGLSPDDIYEYLKKFRHLSLKDIDQKPTCEAYLH